MATVRRARSGAVRWLGRDGATWELTPSARYRTEHARTANVDGTVRSPMPGTVLAVHVKDGDLVEAGQPLLVVEAMKMEHVVRAPLAGLVRGLHAVVGETVRLDEVLVTLDQS